MILVELLEKGKKGGRVDEVRKIEVKI